MAIIAMKTAEASENLKKAKTKGAISATAPLATR